MPVRSAAREVGHATTSTSGSFKISYSSPGAGVLYVDAAPTGSSTLRLRAIVGVGGGGGVPAQTLSNVTVTS